MSASINPWEAASRWEKTQRYVDALRLAAERDKLTLAEVADGVVEGLINLDDVARVIGERPPSPKTARLIVATLRQLHRWGTL